jgi:hypothetical protein
MTIVMLDDSITAEELEIYREKFQVASLNNSNKKFQFALCLIRSNKKSDIKAGLHMFRALFDEVESQSVKRDALYYMAIAETKLKNYDSSIELLDRLLAMKSRNDHLERIYNEQVKKLHNEVNRRKKKDELIGIGVVGSAALVGIAGNSFF